MLCVALALTAAGQISAGEITAYVLLFGAVLSPLRELHRILDEASEASLQTEDLFRLLDSPADHSYSVGADRPGCPTNRNGSTPAIELHGLAYAHPGSESSVLDGVDLRLREGERVGVVGESGCGKSTLLRLLARLHHGYDGEARLHGRDLEAISREELAQAVGYVASTQPRAMFSRTLMRKIRGSWAALIVAHRLMTLRNTDRIVVLGAGQIVEEGPFEVLADREGPFARMLALERLGAESRIAA